MKVTAGTDVPDRDILHYALARWNRTLRLCAIKLSESVPALVPLVWLILRR